MTSSLSSGLSQLSVGRNYCTISSLDLCQNFGKDSILFVVPTKVEPKEARYRAFVVFPAGRTAPKAEPSVSFTLEYLVTVIGSVSKSYREPICDETLCLP